VSLTSPLFFLALLPAGIIFYFMPGRLRALYLLGLSYAFYALSSLLYLILLIAASAAIYGLGIGIARSRSETAKTVQMALGASAVVGAIVAFKAAGAWRGFLLPLGLSYYSFKLLSYLIEVYWDDDAVERDPLIFFLFPAFFPQIVSGPIQRPLPFFEQMRDVMSRRANGAQIESGFAYILGGLMLKIIIGDRLAAFIDVVDKAHADYSYSIVLATVGCYTLQLYADFAGYTNIALGIGKIFGIEGPPNFNAPFAATNIQEMWRRWHMSLTSWVTDYLFTPLSMSLRDFGQTGLIACIMLSMAIIGLWHGLTLNFLVFGLLNGVFVSVTALIVMAHNRRGRIKAKAKSEPRTGSTRRRLSHGGWALGGMTLTFALMSFSQIFWHSRTWDQAISILGQLLTIAPSGSLGWSDIGGSVVLPGCVCAAIALYVGAGAPGAKGMAARVEGFAPRWVQLGVCLFLLSVLANGGGGQFVYGQF
jgi:alginate O-acetyltransferase complex protein AlgI